MREIVKRIGCELVIGEDFGMVGENNGMIMSEWFDRGREKWRYEGVA